MITNPQLAAWLGSRDRQRASHTAVEEFVDQWSGGGLIATLESDLAAIAEPTPDAMLAAACRFLDRIDDIEAMLAALVARSRADPFFMPPMRPISSELHTGILLFQRPDISIALGVSPIQAMAAKKAAPNRPPGSVVFTGFHNLFRYIKAGNAVLSFWELPETDGPFGAATAPHCRMTGRRRIRDGEDLLNDGRRHSFIVEHADGDLVYFQVVVRAGAAPLTIEYDAATRRFIGATGTDEAGARVQMMATLLREMDREDAVPWLRAQLPGSDFHIRWHLMREMLALDAEAVLPDLRAMAADDPHPEVRAAAAETLQVFFADQPEQEPAACHA